MKIKKIALGLSLCLCVNAFNISEVFAYENKIWGISNSDGLITINIGDKKNAGNQWIDQEIMLSPYIFKDGYTYSVGSDNNSIVTCKLGTSEYEEPSIKLIGVSAGTTKIRLYEKSNGKFIEIGRSAVKVNKAESSLFINDEIYKVKTEYDEDHVKIGKIHKTYSIDTCYTIGLYEETLRASSLLQGAKYTCVSNKPGITCETKNNSKGELRNFINIKEYGDYTLSYYQEYNGKKIKYSERNISVKPIQLNKEVWLFKGEAVDAYAVAGYLPDTVAENKALYFESKEQPYTDIYGSLNSTDFWFGFGEDKIKVTEVLDYYKVTFQNYNIIGNNYGDVTLQCYVVDGDVPYSQRAEKGQYIGDVTFHVVPFPAGSPNA
ncbi:hypothetical protein [Anaerotignum propionicum]|uniref:Uncharacterized protein n=1 Tax=Anaerotignum propionicum DSM 1682 TaxID=991789 RepID=A0A110A707_ANAPI|nr:hypothetical protein [Anaerotignum propionicum]AMJ40498.1 hypothetical protein CPRO_08980 [Anaerotignum propionicum DSM 1682]SHE40430.1 hypothetical protein SAMN02745151_00585 [[Clostridium] propionicum DSM 1682] [Anaerotignum propionicum DSM 1682]